MFKAMSFLTKRLKEGSIQRDKKMPDDFCWFQRMKTIVDEHEQREMKIYTDLRKEIQRFHSELAEEQKKIDNKLSALQSQFDRSYAVLAIMKYLVPIGGLIAGAVWWIKDIAK
jgi:hypothetical protein